MDISRQKQKSLVWKGAEDQNPQRVVVSAVAAAAEEEDDDDDEEEEEEEDFRFWNIHGSEKNGFRDGGT